MKERRVAVRAISFFQAEVRHKTKMYVGYVVNISLTGCAFAHENLMSVDEGDAVKVKFRIDGKILNVAAGVCWRDNTIMGLRYKSMSETNKKILKEYIRSVTLRRIPI